MTTDSKPSKQAVRDYMNARAKAKTPPPDLNEIRRQMGWSMLVKAPDCPR